MKKLIILFGGAGFIGSHICEYFGLKENTDIVSIDFGKNFDGEQNKFKYYEYGINIVGTDLSNPITWDIKKETGLELCDYNNIHIYHLASPVGVQNHTEPTFYKAMAITQNIVRFIKNKIIPVIIEYKIELSINYFSTSELYGNISYKDLQTNRPNINLSKFYDIDLHCGGFRSDYIYQKYLSEELMMELKQYNLKIYRLFNIVGKFQDPTKGVFSRFIDNILTGKKSLVSDSTRCYTPIKILLDILNTDQSGYIPSLQGYSIIKDIYYPEMATTLRGEELYLYLFGYIKRNYPKLILNFDYEVTVFPNEIATRGNSNTMSYSDFCIIFGSTIDSIIDLKKGIQKE